MKRFILVFILTICALSWCSPLSAATVTLAWDANTEPGLDGYRVFARKSGETYDYSQPDWEGPETTCTLENLDDRVDYYFIVRAYDGDLESPDSIEVCYDPPDGPEFMPASGFAATWHAVVPHIPAIEYPPAAAVSLPSGDLLYMKGDEMHKLTVDEESTYIDVVCDGYTLRVHSTGEQWDEIEILNNHTTDIGGLRYHVTTASGTFTVGYDTSRTVSIVEQSPARVVIKINGNLMDEAQNVISANSDGIEIYLYIYPDFILSDVIWTLSGDVTLSNDQNNQVNFFYATTANITGYSAVYENASESVAGTYITYNNASYIAMLADQLNIQILNLTHSDDSLFDQYVYGSYRLGNRWNNGTLASGQHTMTTLFVIDSASREGSAKKYTSTDRLAMGEQWKDLELGTTYQEPDYSDDPANAVYSCIYPTGYTLSDDETTKYGTRKYTNLNAWYLDRRRDLTSGDGETEICEIIGGDDTYNWNSAGADTTDPEMSGFTTAEGEEVIIRAIGTARHKGVWDDNCYRRITGSNVETIDFRDDYLTLDGFQLYSQGHVGNQAVFIWSQTSSNLTQIKNMIIRGDSSGALDGAAYGVRPYATDQNTIITNTIIYGFASTTDGDFMGIYGYGNMWIYNCIVQDAYFGIRNISGTMVVKNTVVMDCVDDFYSTIDIDNCASNDGDGDNALTISDFSDEMEDPDNQDFRLKSTSQLIGAGISVSDAAHDILNNDRTRHLNYDIGAFQYTNNPVVGLPVVDNRIPAILGRSGFAADGALHVEPDTNGEVKFTFDRTRHNQSVVIHDASFQTGTVDAPTEHLVAHFKLDQAYETSKIREEVSGNNIGSGADSGCTFTDGVQGNGCLFDASTEYVRLSDTEQTALGMSYNKGTIIFDFIPDVDSPSAFYYLINGEDADWFQIRYGYGNIELIIGENWSTVLDLSWDEADFLAGVKYTVHFAWDMSTPHAQCFINGKVLPVDTAATFSAFTTTVPMIPYLYFGNRDNSDANYCHGKIDTLKWYSEPILPYGGGPFLTNDGSDYSKAHESMLAHWDFEGTDETERKTDKINEIVLSEWGTAAGITTTAKKAGTYGYDRNGSANAQGMYATVTSGNIFDPTHGSMRGWINVQTTPDAYAYFLVFVDSSSNYIGLRVDTSGNWNAYYDYGAGQVNLQASSGPTVGNWYYFDMRWSDSDNNGFLELYINGVLMADTTIGNAFGGATSGILSLGSHGQWNVGTDIFLDMITITDDPNTPDNWSAFGKPELCELLEVTD